MAFVSKDWRDPGYEYVKTQFGAWESKKIQRIRMFELLNESVFKRAVRQSISNFQRDSLSTKDYLNDFKEKSNGFHQPYIIIKSCSTKESKILTSLSEALLSLDFKVAIRDIRRFAYVYRVLKILIIQKISYLSGRTQIFIFELLKEIMKQVIETQSNVHLMLKMLEDLEVTLEKNKYNHVGSSQLWKNHIQDVQDMKIMIKNIKSKDVSNSGILKLENLPNECILKILQNLSCPEDIEMIGQTSYSLQTLANDELLWRQLVSFHFNNNQLSSILSQNQKFSFDDCNWKFIYTRLLKKYGDQHYFPVKLAKCCHCSGVFWPIFGHPCNSETEFFNFLSPENFIELFNI